MSIQTKSAQREISPRLASKLAGISYAALFVLAIFANFFVREGLIEPGDAVATAANISRSEGLFRLGLVAFLVIFVLDVGVAWLLHILFRRVSRDVSLVAAWFRLVYTVFLGVALIFFFLVLQLLSGADYLAAFGPGQVEAQVVLLLDAFNFTWMIGLVAFGIHLVILGFLVLRSGSMPKALGGLLAVAGIGYMVDTLGLSLLSNYTDYESVFMVIVAVPAVIGELAFTLWLLLRGGKSEISA